jgi:hypothetical protein
MTVDEQVRPNGRARMVTRPFIEPAWAFDYVDQGGGEVLIGYRRTVARSRWARRWEVEVLTPVDEADGSDERKTALLQANFVGGRDEARHWAMTVAARRLSGGML